MRSFDRKTEVTESKSNNFKDQVEIAWGDLHNPDDIVTAERDRDVSIHIAFALPPMTEYRPEKARGINIGGTENILNAMKSLSPAPKIILASSSSVFSINPSNPLPRTVSDPVETTDHYTQHKLECEKMVQESGLDWVISRFGIVPPVVLNLDFWVFHVPPDTQMQFLHPKDVGPALANAMNCREVWGKILLIGSGPSNQIYYRDFVRSLTAAMGIRTLPDEAFSTKPYYTVWMDTSKSQRLLNYHRHSFEEFSGEMRSLIGYWKYYIMLLRPIYRRRLLKKALYLQSKN